jgi:hypothetical protein
LLNDFDWYLGSAAGDEKLTQVKRQASSVVTLWHFHMPGF